MLVAGVGPTDRSPLPMSSTAPLPTDLAHRQREAERFDVLGSARRRHLLRALEDRGGAGPLVAVATDVAAVELAVPADTVPPRDRKRVYISCYQTHVPRLEATGYVEYDAETGVVGLTDRAAELGGDLGWTSPAPRVPAAMVATAVLAAIGFGGVLLGLPGLGSTSPAVAGLLVVAALAGVAVATVLRDRGRRPS